MVEESDHDKCIIVGKSRRLTLETMRVDCLDEEEEVCSMLGVLLEILVDHLQRTFEHGVQDLRHVLDAALKKRISP